MSEVLGSRSRGFYSKKFALLFEEFARSYFANLGKKRVKNELYQVTERRFLR